MGTGLGLTIAKKIVNNNFKGELTFLTSTTHPTGTTFTVSIPFPLPDIRKRNSLKYIDSILKRNSETEHTETTNNSEGANKGHLLHKELFVNRERKGSLVSKRNGGLVDKKIFDSSILLAEDNPINLSVLKRLLEKGGFKNITTSNNGLELVEAFKYKFHDLIITDLHMPYMSGIEAANAIRKLEGGDKTKIIILTADALLDKFDYMESIDASLNKPISKDNLNKAIMSALS